MAQILVRNLDPATVRRLKQRAEANGRSLQSEAKLILEQASDEGRLPHREALELADRFRKQFKGRTFDDSAGLIREDRDR